MKIVDNNDAMQKYVKIPLIFLMQNIPLSNNHFRVNIMQAFLNSFRETHSYESL